MRPRNLFAVAFVGWGGMMLGFCLLGIWARSSIEVSGTITSSETKCEPPRNSRCFTRYRLVSSNGAVTQYTAGPNDHSLRRWLPVGTRLDKRRGQLTYRIDGQLINDFPLVWYEVIGVVGATLLLVGAGRTLRLLHRVFVPAE